MKSSPESAVKFFVFEKTKRVFGETDAELNSYQLFISGSAGGLVSQLAGYPMDVIKTR